jgi:Acyl-CoA thioester hydrolase/BAAT N-terminal region
MGGPTSATHTRTFAITFGIAFTLMYTVFERLNWPLFTYQPAVGKLYFWLHRPLSGEGPPMYWHGWIVLAAASALAVAWIATIISGQWLCRATIILTATQIFPSHSRWQVHATFVTGEEGDVAVAQRAPTSGSYEGVAAMGLIWSAERVLPPSSPIPEDWILQPSFIYLEAVGPNDPRAELTITRHSVGPGVTRQTVRTDGLVGVLFLPPGEGPHPSVLILQGGGAGVDETSTSAQ